MRQPSQKQRLRFNLTGNESSGSFNSLPDSVEEPGLRLDFVVRQNVEVYGREVGLKFEARNLTNENYEEFQSTGNSRIDNNSYAIGRNFSIGASISF